MLDSMSLTSASAAAENFVRLSFHELTLAPLTMLTAVRRYIFTDQIKKFSSLSTQETFNYVPIGVSERRLLFLSFSHCIFRRFHTSLMVTTAASSSPIHLLLHLPSTHRTAFRSPFFIQSFHELVDVTTWDTKQRMEQGRART